MEFVITTDLTIEGTTIKKDGIDMSDALSIASLTFYADAPNKKYQEAGYVSLSVRSFDSEGNTKSERYSHSNSIVANIVPIGVQDSVEFAKTDVIRFLGKSIDTEATKLVDSIIEKSKKDGIKCPDRELLLSRSVESLRDKSLDLGITLEDIQN